MDPNKGYRSFCIHVKNLIGFICGVEIVVILISVMSRVHHPLVVCRFVNVSSLGHEPGLGYAGALAGRSGPTGRLMVEEERICSTYSLLICFALFHAVCDFITLISLGVEKDRLVLPLLLVLALNILVSSLFIASALFTFLFASTTVFDGYFFFFVLAQTFFRLYEFICARRLYWYYQFCADVRQIPQSSLLRDENDSLHVFQF